MENLACYILQWNPSIAATLGEQKFGLYIGVAFIEGLFCTQSVHLGPGFLWPLYRGGLYSGVAVKRGSTVLRITVLWFLLFVSTTEGLHFSALVFYYWSANSAALSISHFLAVSTADQLQGAESVT